jgi:hypothetical protein
MGSFSIGSASRNTRGCQDSRNRSCGSSDIDGIIIVIIIKGDDPV